MADVRGLQDRPLLGMACRVLAMAVLATMAMLIKLVGERGVHVFEIVFYRYLIGAIIMFGWMFARGELKSLKSERMPLHAVRSIIGMFAMALNFWTVMLLPLAEAAVLSFAVPLLSTALSVVVLSEVVGIRRWSAVAIGFIGVLISVQPGQSDLPIVGIASGLLGALGSSLAIVLVRKLSTTESSSATVFFYMAMAMPVMAMTLPFVGQVHDPETFALVLLLCAIGTIGLFINTESLRLANVAVLAPMDYTWLIFAAFYGYVIFNDWPDSSLWLGLPFIVGAGVYIAVRQRHRKLMPQR